MVPYDKRSTFAHCVRFALSGNLLLSIFMVSILLPNILAETLISKEENREVFPAFEPQGVIKEPTLIHQGRVNATAKVNCLLIGAS
jgi:hypothetical protein